MRFGHAGHGRHHGNGGLATAGDHVDVALLQVLLQVDHRHAVGTDGRRGQIDHANAGFVVTKQLVIVNVSAGRGGIKHNVDIGKLRHLHQPLHAVGGRGHAHAGGTSQAVGLGVNADHHAHFDVLAVAQDLDHQVGANIARTDDRGFDFLAHDVVLFNPGQAKRTEALPIPPMSTRM